MITVIEMTFGKPVSDVAVVSEDEGDGLTDHISFGQDVEPYWANSLIPGEVVDI